MKPTMQGFHFLIGILTLCVGLYAAPLAAQPQYQHQQDGQRSGSASGRGPVSSAPGKLWMNTTSLTQTTGTIATGLAIAADNTLYTTDTYSGGKLLALNPTTGALKWTFDPAANGIPATYFPAGLVPAVGSDGTIYITTWINDIISIPARYGPAVIGVNPNGTKRFFYFNDYNSASGSTFSINMTVTPLLGPDGTVYFEYSLNGDSNLYLEALNPDGTLLWKKTYPNRQAYSYAFYPPLTALSMSPDSSTLYSVNTNTSVTGGIAELVAYNAADGSMQWKHPISGAQAGPVVGPDGKVFVVDSVPQGTSLPYYYVGAYAASDGSQAWRRKLYAYYSSPAGMAAAKDNRLYVIEQGLFAAGRLEVFDQASGTPIWSFSDTAGQTGFGGAPIVLANGVVYFTGSIAYSCWPIYGPPTYASNCSSIWAVKQTGSGTGGTMLWNNIVAIYGGSPPDKPLAMGGAPVLGSDGTLYLAAVGLVAAYKDMNIYFDVSIGSSIASVCAPKSITITVRNSDNSINTTYTGTIIITDSTGHGNWAKVTGTGAVLNAGFDVGTAGYTFSVADHGVVTLSLADTHAEDTWLSVSDPAYASGSSNPTLSFSPTISFRDNVFVLTPMDSLGTTVVAGRSHGFTAAMWLKDPSSGNCQIVTTYTGNRNLDAWLTRDSVDPNGLAPLLQQAAGAPQGPLPSTSTDSTVSGSTHNNVTLNFSNGTANFNLVSAK